MAFYLVLSLAAVAGLFFLAGADFLGAMQLMVYVGGTLVLLVFGVMLTARGPFVSHADRRRAMDPGRCSSAAALLAVLLQAVERRRLGRPPRPKRAAAAVAPAANVDAVGHGPVGRPHRSPRAGRRCRGDVAGYLLVFEIISVHLLVVLVGAAYLARAKRAAVEPGGARPQAYASPSRAEDVQHWRVRTPNA